jgi:hypothetical protein
MMNMSKHSIWKKTIAIVVVCLFLANQLAWAYPHDTLATPAGDSKNYEAMLDDMWQEYYDEHENTLDDFIAKKAKRADQDGTLRTLSDLTRLKALYDGVMQDAGATQANLDKTFTETGGQIQLVPLTDEEMKQIPSLREGRIKPTAHAGTYVTKFVTYEQLEIIENGTDEAAHTLRMETLGDICHEIRAKSRRAEEIWKEAASSEQPKDREAATALAARLEDTFEKINLAIAQDIAENGRITRPDLQEEFKNLDFKEKPSPRLRDLAAGGKEEAINEVLREAIQLVRGAPNEGDLNSIISSMRGRKNLVGIAAALKSVATALSKQGMDSNYIRSILYSIAKRSDIVTFASRFCRERAAIPLTALVDTLSEEEKDVYDISKLLEELILREDNIKDTAASLVHNLRKLSDKISSDVERGIFNLSILTVRNEKTGSSGSAFVIGETETYYLCLTNEHIASDVEWVVLERRREGSRDRKFGGARVVVKRQSESHPKSDIALLAIAKNTVMIESGEKLRPIPLAVETRKHQIAAVVSGFHAPRHFVGCLLDLEYGAFLAGGSGQRGPGDSGSPFLIFQGKYDNPQTSTDDYAVFAVCAKEAFGAPLASCAYDILEAFQKGEHGDFVRIVDEESLMDEIGPTLSNLFTSGTMGVDGHRAEDITDVKQATPEEVELTRADVNRVGDLIWNEFFTNTSIANFSAIKDQFPIILDLDFLPENIRNAIRESLNRNVSIDNQGILALIEANINKRLTNANCFIILTEEGEGHSALLDHAGRVHSEYGKRPILITTEAKTQEIASLDQAEVRLHIRDITAVTPRPERTYTHMQAVVSYAVIKSQLTEEDLRSRETSPRFQALSSLHEFLTGISLVEADIPLAILQNPAQSAIALLIGTEPAGRLFDDDQMRQLMEAEELRLRAA